MKLLKKIKGIWVLAACYLAGVALLLCLHSVQFIGNRMAYQSGQLQHRELIAEDFEWEEIVEKDGELITIGSDPKLILKDSTVRVETLWAEIEYSQPPRVVTAFWAEPGQGHSVRRMVYPAEKEGGMWFLLPPEGGQSFRLDPDVVPGNRMVIHSLQINKPRSFWEFYIFTAKEWTALLVLPALAASAVSIGSQGLDFLRGKKEGEKTHV